MAANQRDINGVINRTEHQSNAEVMVLETYNGENAPIKTGIGSSSSSSFRAIPPFLQKLYEMLENDEFSPVVSWSCAGTSFVIKNPHSFAANVLPLYFKHNNFQNFITQLHSYGFKKSSWEQCEYKNEYFKKGDRTLLKNIKRRDHYSKTKPSCVSSASPCPCSINMESTLTIMMKENDQIKAGIIKLKEVQRALDVKLASLKNQNMTNEEMHNRMMTVARRILEKEKDKSNDDGLVLPLLEESREIKSQVEGKMVSEEEDMANHTFFKGQMDWVEYVKELQENASWFKS